MSKTNQPFLEIFPEIFAEDVERTFLNLTRIHTKIANQEMDLDAPVYFLALSYETLAIGECILYDDALKSKQYFYLTAKLREELIRHYDAGGPILVEKSSVAMNNYLTLFRALASDCDELIDSLARLIGGRPEAEAAHGHPFADHVGYAMKYILLDEYSKAQHHVDQLKTIADDPDLEFVQGYTTVLQGIVQSDRQLVNVGLRLQLQLHRQNPEHQGLPEEVFSLPVLALAKLAMRRGLEVGLDDPLTPAAMLQKQQIEYPPLDYLPSIRKFEN